MRLSSLGSHNRQRLEDLLVEHLDAGLLAAAALLSGCGPASTGFVHRDLKPSNIILAPDGPRVIDFGIARAADATALTTTNLRIGSPGYMAPEQIRTNTTGPESDIFALGCVLAYAATGQSPFGTGPISHDAESHFKSDWACVACPGKPGFSCRGARCSPRPTGIGHYGTGDLELRIRNATDFTKAQPLIQQSYSNG